MSSSVEKYNQLKLSLVNLANCEKAVSMASYMRNQFAFYGVPAAGRKLACKEIIKSDAKAGVIDWVLLDLCFNDEHREMQYFVIDYLGAQKKRLTYDDVPRLYRYAKNKQWWDTIDFLDRIIGGIAFVDSRINDLMLRWSTDRDFWIRRIAIDHQNGRRERTDEKLLETILVNNFGSKEFFINKAIGWSLREYSKTNPGWVAQFIATNRSRMSSLSIREGSKRL